VPYLAISNGTDNIAAQINFAEGSFNFLNAFPGYEALNF
jgi:hypothetical protein